MALRREVMLMSEEEVIHFARSKLDQPEKVLLKLEEAEIDGEALLLCTERNIDKVLPGLAVGPCLKLLNRLQSALEASGSEETQSRSGTSSPVLSARHHDELTLALSPTSSWSSSPQSHVSPSTPRRPRSQSPPSSDQSDAENQPPREGSPQTVRVAPKPVRLVSSTSVPYSGEFPISKLVFGPASQQACRSGIVSREAKSEILQTLHSKIIQLSYDKVYGDRKIREDAAEALVKHYPQLKEGRSSRDAVLSWRNSLTTKGKNVRRGLDLSASPRLLVEKNKHKASRLQAKTGPEDGRKRRKVTVSSLDSEEEEELRVHQQELKGEFLKPKRDRNMRAIKHLSEKTFSLRRKDILEETSHLSQILRDWPALRCADMIIQDLLWIVRIGQTNLRAIPSADILSYADEYALKLSRSHPLLHVLHPHGKAEDDEVINQSIAVATLPYFLPTKVKKTILQTHRYMIDLYPADKPLDEIKTDVSERNQPWILLRGSWAEIERIQVVADGVCVTGANTVHEAIHTVIALHYIQHVEYNRQVKMAMKYLEQVVCGCPRVGYEDYRDITSFVNVLEKRSNCS